MIINSYFILQVISLMMLSLIIYVVVENISQVVRIATMTRDLMIMVRIILRDHHQVMPHDPFSL